MKSLKQINWTDLSGFLVGIFLTIALVVFGVTLYAKLFSSGVIGVKEYMLYSDFDKVLGLHPGTPVQIRGVGVGQISKMNIESSGKVRLEFTIRQEFQPWITDSATVFAIRDQNVISARVVNIDVHRERGHVLQNGDYLPAGQAQDIETMLETTNQLLRRVNDLVDAADTLVQKITDTNTTVGALLGSRHLYDDVNRQLVNLNRITYHGAQILDTLGGSLPPLLRRVDTVSFELVTFMDGVRSVPTQLNHSVETLDTLMVRAGGVLSKADEAVGAVGHSVKSLDHFVSSSEETLQSANDLMSGLLNMWLIRRSIPKKDSIPFVMEEELW